MRRCLCLYFVNLISLNNTDLGVGGTASVVCWMMRRLFGSMEMDSGTPRKCCAEAYVYILGITFAMCSSNYIGMK